MTTPVLIGTPEAKEIQPFERRELLIERAAVLTETVRAAKAHVWKIAAFVSLSVAGTYFFSMQMPRHYQGIATLEINRETPSSLVGERTDRGDLFMDDDVYIATQMKLIQLDSVLGPVSEKFRLRKGDGQTAMTPVKANAGIPGLKVSRLPNTRLVQIRYISSSPQVAAEVVNAIANKYLERSYTSRINSSAAMSRYAEQQLGELKEKMQRSSLALAQRQKELNLVNADEKVSLVSARLVQLNTDYMDAQSDRFRKEAAFNRAKSENLDAAQASSLSEPLRKLMDRRNDLEEKFSQIKEHYGSDHPEYRRNRAQMAELDRQIHAMKHSIAARIEALYQESVDRENMIAASLRRAKLEADQLNGKYLDYERLRRGAESDARLFEQLQQRVKETDINSSFRNETVRIVDAARPADAPVSPNPPLAAACALLFSSGLGIGTAFAREKMSNSFRNARELEQAEAAPVLGILPAMKKTKEVKRASLTAESTALEVTSPKVIQNLNNLHASAFTEAVRSVRNTVQLRFGSSRMRTVLVTSALPGEGKTTIAVHVGIANALRNRKTLLIDADLRRPSVHRLLDIPNASGLADYLAGSDWKGNILRAEGLPALHILPAGTPGEASFDLLSDRLSALLERAAAEYDVIVVDAAPALGCSETLPIAAAADGVVVVVAASGTGRDAVRTVVSDLKMARANVLGFVLNKVATEHCPASQYSGHYSDSISRA